MVGGASPNSMNSHANHQHVITVATEAARDWSSVLQRRLGHRPTRLKHSAGSDSCCIFRVPGTLREVNPKAYRPRIVSIGPYHHGKEECVQMIEEHKPRFFSTLVSRTRNLGVDCNEYFNAIASREEEIRDCYSEPLNFGSDELIEMMVFDGCFIIELFRVIEGIITPDPDDPIFNMLWTFTAFMRDFLHLENQVPFFVLQTLYDLSKGPGDDDQYSLVKLALQFFNYGVQRPPEVLEKYYDVSDVKHLLHLIHMSFINLPPEDPREFDSEYLQLVHSVTKLRRSGVKFRPRKCDGWLNIRFNKGVLEIPPLTIDELTSSFFLNCVAFEQCYCYCSQHVTSYVTFMGCLMATADDASFLSDHHVVENYFGTSPEVASFFNNLGKDVGFDISRSYLAGVMEDLNRYHRNRWRVRWTGLKRKYFGTPWSFISALAAFIILVLTFIQSFFALYAYVRPPKQS